MAGITKREQINRKIAKSLSKKTPEVIKKLEEAFAIDADVEGACFYADIAESTYYDWIKKDPKLSERFKALQNKPVLLAQQTIVKKISDSYANAMDFLSRRRKERYSHSSNITAAQVNIDIKKDKAELFKILEENRNDNST